MLKDILPKKSFFSAAVGTMVEYYDYAAFSTLLAIVAPLFFPADSMYQSLVKAYYMLLITMLARPIGAVMFGYVGDRFGRRVALLSSMYGIALATLAIGLTPTYATLGVWSVVIIVVAKFVQIACFGGDYNGAGIYVVEHANNHNEAFVGSLLTASTMFGSLIASFIGMLITLPFMPAWSWRGVFILGGVVGIIGIMYRKNLVESPQFVSADVTVHSWRNLLRQYPRELFAGVFIGGFATVPFTTVVLFILPVLMSQGYLTRSQLMVLQTALITLAVVAVTIQGRIADIISPYKMMRIGSYALVIGSYPLLCLVDTGNIWLLVLALAMLVIIAETFLAPTNAYLKHLFPAQYRYRGSSLGFCIGMSLLGGATPMMANFLYKATGNFSTVSIWLMFVGLGALASLSLVQQRTQTTRVLSQA